MLDITKRGGFLDVKDATMENAPLRVEGRMTQGANGFRGYRLRPVNTTP